MELIGDDVSLLILLKLYPTQTPRLLSVCKLWQRHLTNIVNSDIHKYFQFKNKICNKAELDWYSWSKLPGSVFHNMGIINAAKSGNLELTKLIIRCNIEQQLYSQSLIIAIECQNLEIVKLLLTSPDTNPTLNNNQSLYTAVDGTNTEIVQILLQHPNINPTIGNSELLRYALQSKKKYMVDILLEDDRVFQKVKDHKILHHAAMEFMFRENGNDYQLLMSNYKIKQQKKSTPKQGWKQCILF
jgi:hypothetical protein